MTGVGHAIRRMLGRWRLRIWIALAVVFGVLLGLVPLFGVLGFELALATAVFGAVSGLDLGAALARELQAVQGPALARATYPGRALATSATGASGLAVAVVAIPGVISAVRGIWVPTCDWWFGLVAFAAMPVATAALAGALGHVIAVAVGVRARVRRLPHRGTVLALLALLVIAAGGVLRFYEAPPVFTYNAIIGYFPGNLYDENVRLGAPLAWARLEQLLWVVALGALVATRLDVPRFRMTREPRPGGRRLGALGLALACGGAAMALHLHGGALGYSVDADDIEAALDGRIETAHFVIHYARTPEIEADLALIAADHELRYAQVVGQLGIATEGKLRSFYFANGDQKARWMGARDVEMTKPWRHEFYLDHRAFPHPSLRHEIAHAVASTFGDPIFGVAARRVLGVPVFINPGLIEGLAVAIDWPGGYDRLTPHEAVRAMQVMGLTPTIGELFSLRFFEFSSARGYTTAGSFLRFLLERYGVTRLRAVYANGGDFAAAYDKPLAALETEWRTMIAAIELPPDVIEGSRERFRGTSVFARPCPHAIAARRERAVMAYVTGNRPRAIDLMRHVCDDAPDEPRHRLELGDYLVRGTPPEHAEALGLWTALSDDPDHVTSSVRADALERLAQAAAARGDLATTTTLIDRARALPVDANARRQLDAESLALHHEGLAGPALRGYFFASPGVLDGPGWALLATLAEPELGFGYYLLGIQAFNKPDWGKTADMLDRALARGLPGPGFVRNAARKLALAAYRTHDPERMAHALAALRGPGMATTDALLADDWSQRLGFDATGRL